MQDPTEHEIAAMMFGAQMGGEYLDSIGKTDLGALSEDEYMTFIECVITGFTDKLAEMNKPPF